MHINIHKCTCFGHEKALEFRYVNTFVYKYLKTFYIYISSIYIYLYL